MTYPLTGPIPFAIPNNDDDFTDEEFTDEDENDDDEDIVPDFDLGALNGSDDEDDDDEDIPGQGPIAIGGALSGLINLGKPAPPMLFPAQRAPVTPIIPTMQPVVPFPQQVTQPVAPVGGLKLTLMPMAAPQATAVVPTQMAPFPTPGLPKVNIPISPIIVPGATKPAPTLTLMPQVQIATQPLVQIATQPLVPQVPVATQPLVPQVQGVVPTQAQGAILTQPLVPQVQGKAPAKTIDVEAILTKMSGINVISVTPNPVQTTVDINDLLQKETDETLEDFESRKILTLKLASIPNYKLNNTTAVTAGHMIMKKSKLGMGYDQDVESALAYLLESIKE